MLCFLCEKEPIVAHCRTCSRGFCIEHQPMAGWQCDTCELEAPEGRNRPGLGGWALAGAVVWVIASFGWAMSLPYALRRWVAGILVSAGIMLFVYLDERFR